MTDIIDGAVEMRMKLKAHKGRLEQSLMLKEVEFQEVNPDELCEMKLQNKLASS